MEEYQAMVPFYCRQDLATDVRLSFGSSRCNADSGLLFPSVAQVFPAFKPDCRSVSYAHSLLGAPAFHHVVDTPYLYMDWPSVVVECTNAQRLVVFCVIVTIVSGRTY